MNEVQHPSEVAEKQRQRSKPQSSARAPRRRGKIVEKEGSDPNIVPIAPDENIIEQNEDTTNEAEKIDHFSNEVKPVSIPKENTIATEKPASIQQEEIPAVKEKSVTIVQEEIPISTEEPPAFYTYAVEKIKSGISISQFNLSFQAALKIVGKYEKSLFGISKIVFTENGSMCASMDIEKDTKFTLKNKDGAPQCIINVVRPGGNSSLPRHWSVKFVGQDKQMGNLVSETPRVNEKGQYELFFGGKLTMNSVKNAILIDEVEQAEVIGIRKIDKNTLEIDGSTEYDKLTLFALGIASFLSK